MMGLRAASPWPVVSRIHVLLGQGELHSLPHTWTPLPVSGSRPPVADRQHTHTHTHTHERAHTLGLHGSGPGDNHSSPAAPPVCAPISPPSWPRWFCPVCPLVDRTAASQTETEWLLLCGGEGTGPAQSTAMFLGLVGGRSLHLCDQAPHSSMQPSGRRAQPRAAPQ